MSLFDEGESSIQTKVIKRAKKRGWRARKWTSPGHKGVTDYFFTKYPCRVIFVEFKRDGEDSTPLQKHEQKLLRKEGFPVFQIDNAEDGYALFD